MASQESPGRQIRASSIRAKSSYEARQKLKDGREVKGFLTWSLWWRSKGVVWPAQTVLLLLSEDSPEKPTTGTVLTLAQHSAPSSADLYVRTCLFFPSLISLQVLEMFFLWHLSLERLYTMHKQRHDSSVHVHFRSSLFFCLFFFFVCSRPVQTQNKYLYHHTITNWNLLWSFHVKLLRILHGHLKIDKFS